MDLKDNGFCLSAHRLHWPPYEVLPLAWLLQIIGPSRSSDNHIECRFRFKFKVIKDLDLEPLTENDTKPCCNDV